MALSVKVQEEGTFEQKEKEAGSVETLRTFLADGVGPGSWGGCLESREEVTVAA